MQKSSVKKRHRVWLLALLLAVCVAASTLVVTDRLHGFMMDDSGAIELMAESNSPATEDKKAADDKKTENKTTSDEKSDSKSAFEVSDDAGVWTTNTPVEIFYFTYRNGEGQVTVNSENTENVIAPGTENSYTFKLKNSGDTALDYTVTLEAYYTPGGINIPITARLSRYDGKWLVGDKNTYENALNLHETTDSDTLGAGKYTYYTLDWVWPFESGLDEQDTWLGNEAVKEDLTFTIVIKTVAEISEDTDSKKGITAPQTGDSTRLALLLSIAFGAFALMILLLILYLRDKRKEEEVPKS